LAQSQQGEVPNVKTYYSAQDIEALAAQGVRELVVDENSVLTDLARDAAVQLGVRLVAPGRPPTAGSASAPKAAAPSGGKPRGCQHGPLSGSPAVGAAAAPTKSAGNSPVMDELVGAVRQLAGKQGRG
jgi:hypothetical protein